MNTDSLIKYGFGDRYGNLLSIYWVTEKFYTKEQILHKPNQIFTFAII